MSSLEITAADNPAVRPRGWMAWAVSALLHTIALAVLARSARRWPQPDPFAAGSRVASAVSVAAQFTGFKPPEIELVDSAAVTVQPDRASLRDVEFVALTPADLSVAEAALVQPPNRPAESARSDSSWDPHTSSQLDRPIGQQREPDWETASVPSDRQLEAASKMPPEERAQESSEPPKVAEPVAEPASKPQVDAAQTEVAEVTNTSSPAVDAPNSGEAAVSSAPQTVGTHEELPAPHSIFNPPPIYPAGAVLARQQGLTVLEVTIAADGHVAQVKVVQSSGFPVLDGAAVAAVSRWRFERRASHQPLHDWVGQLSVRFRLQ